MSTLGLPTVGTNYGSTPAVAQTRGVAWEPVPFIGIAAADQAAANQAQGSTGIPGAETADDQISQEAALVNGAISMPARPLAEIIWQLRAEVNAGRGSVRASRGQPSSRDGDPPTTRDGRPIPVPSTTGIRVAARAYTDVQELGSRPTPARTVDIYHGKK